MLKITELCILENVEEKNIVFFFFQTQRTLRKLLIKIQCAWIQLQENITNEIHGNLSSCAYNHSLKKKKKKKAAVCIERK